MIFQYTPYTIPLVFVTLVSGTATYLSWRKRGDSRATFWFTAHILVLFVWSFLLLLTVSSVSYEMKLLWLKILLPVTASLPPVWLIYTLVYTGRENLLSRRVIGLLFVPVVLYVVLSATNEFHELM
ncbi:MAG: histidine kinase N-terminal 7TM domain-containing protein, partial [Halobacteria archaeon]|nr:histidine kinase N-terminal 7TM domain-containing protein [Halobacteria archaeon]